MINSITRKFLASITVCLLLASMFTGVALAKPAMQEYRDLKFYNNVALIMQRSDDPVRAFYTLSTAEQGQVRETMRFHYKNMQAIVERGGSDEDLQAYFATIHENIRYIIEIDFTYTRYESSEGYGHDSEYIFNHQHDDDENGNYTAGALIETQYIENALVNRLKPDNATCPDDYPCWMYRWYEHTCYGSINGQKHWTMYTAISAQHNASHIDWTVGSQTSYKYIYNGWSAKAGTWTQTLSKTYVDTPYYSLMFGATNLTNCEFSNGLFSTEKSQIAVTISVDATGECYITWVDATITTSSLPGINTILSAIAFGIALASGNIPGIIISGYFFVDSLVKLN